MKIIDRNGRLFGKISIIDVLVIVVVAVMAVALYVKTNHKEITGTTAENPSIKFQILVEGVRTYVGDAVQVGDKLYDLDYSSGGEALGKITAIEVMPGSSLTEFSDGTSEVVPMEDCVNLLLTVEGEGIVNDGFYSINRVYNLGVNSHRNYYTRFAQFKGTVYSIF